MIVTNWEEGWKKETGKQTPIHVGRQTNTQTCRQTMLLVSAPSSAGVSPDSRCFSLSVSVCLDLALYVCLLTRLFICLFVYQSPSVSLCLTLKQCLSFRFEPSLSSLSLPVWRWKQRARRKTHIAYIDRQNVDRESETHVDIQKRACKETDRG